MLTIKHIEKSGSESISEAKEISFYGDERQAPRVHAYGVGDPDAVDGHIQYGNGIVYVMNASGSTIAKYDLDLENEDFAARKRVTKIKTPAATIPTPKTRLREATTLREAVLSVLPKAGDCVPFATVQMAARCFEPDISDDLLRYNMRSYAHITKVCDTEYVTRRATTTEA